MIRIFNVKRGDQFTFTITFTNLTENLSSFTMGVKQDYDKPLLITKGLGHGITKVSTNKYRVDFTPEETKSLVPDFYLYDLRMTLGSTVFTPLYGYINIEETVFD